MRTKKELSSKIDEIENEVKQEEIVPEIKDSKENIVNAVEQINNQDAIQVDDENGVMFEGGPTKKTVNEWIEKYGEVYASALGLDVYIWKCLNRKEYKEIVSQEISNFDKEEKYCQACLLWPEDVNFEDGSVKAGVPTILTEQILLRSGFQAEYEPVQL